MFETVIYDIQRYKKAYGVRKIFEFRRLMISQSLWAVLIYRFGRWCSGRSRKNPIFIFLKIIYVVLNKLICELLLGIYLPAGCRIGKGLYLGGFLGLVINSATVIGENCSISHGVVIGTAGDGTPRAPSLGNNVYIGTGAVIIGNINIGDNVRIGANSVVNKSFPSDVTIAGVPATIVKG